jgi:hypothetical protein
MFKKTETVLREIKSTPYDYVWCMDGRRMCKNCVDKKKKILKSLVGYDDRNKMKLDPAYELVAHDLVQEDEEIHCDWCGEDIYSTENEKED